MRYVLIGNFGVGNLGDEALRQYFEESFPIEWQVISARKHGSDLPRLPLGLHSLFRPWWKTIIALWRADTLVFGGGSLFTDTESVFACILWWWHAAVARLLGCKIILAFQGIGPFQTSIGRTFAHQVVGWASAVSVRDEESYARVFPLRKDVLRTADPVLAAFTGTHTGGKGLLLIPRLHSGQEFTELAETYVPHFSRVHILSMHPENSLEQDVCTTLKQKFQADVSFVGSLEELCSAVLQSDFVVSHRFHGALAALALGVPYAVCPQKEGDKLSALDVSVEKQTALREKLLELVHRGEEHLSAILVSS